MRSIVPAAAALIGAARVVPQEYPALRCRSIDLAPGDVSAETAARVAAEAVCGRGGLRRRPSAGGTAGCAASAPSAPAAPAARARAARTCSSARWRPQRRMALALAPSRTPGVRIALVTRGRLDADHVRADRRQRRRGAGPRGGSVGRGGAGGCARAGGGALRIAGHAWSSPRTRARSATSRGIAARSRRSGPRSWPRTRRSTRRAGGGAGGARAVRAVLVDVPLAGVRGERGAGCGWPPRTPWRTASRPRARLDGAWGGTAGTHGVRRRAGHRPRTRCPPRWTPCWRWPASRTCCVSTSDLEARIRAAAAPAARAEGEAAAPLYERPELDVEYHAPTNEVEETLAELWQGLLGIERVGIHDDFFGLGGHSLLATQIVARVRDLFALDLPLQAIFEAPDHRPVRAAHRGRHHRRARGAVRGRGRGADGAGVPRRRGERATPSRKRAGEGINGTGGGALRQAAQAAGAPPGGHHAHLPQRLGEVGAEVWAAAWAERPPPRPSPTNCVGEGERRDGPSRAGSNSPLSRAAGRGRGRGPRRAQFDASRRAARPGSGGSRLRERDRILPSPGVFGGEAGREGAPAQ